VKKPILLNGFVVSLTLLVLVMLAGQAQARLSSDKNSRGGPYVPAVLADPGDWPMYGHDPQRTNYNPAEAVINFGNASQLVERWRVNLGNNSPTSSAPNVSNGKVYAASSVTSGDNYFAYDAVSGAPVWSTSVGHGSNCFNVGIGATAAISGSVISVGGGDKAYYGLNADTGAQLWREEMDPTPNTNPFPWASPLLAYGRSYLGIAACADNPSERGEIRSVDMNVGGQLANQYFVPAGQRGAGIWNSPALSPDGSLLVVATGEDYGGYNGPYNRALVSLDPITLDILQADQQGPTGGDVDYATTPLFFSDNQGRTLVGAVHKNGHFYAYVANDIDSGWIWDKQIGYSAGMMPAYDPKFGSGGTLYLSNGSRVYAVNPLDGSNRWAIPYIQSGSLHGNMAVANGLLYLNSGGILQIYNELDGSLIRSITPTTTGSTYSGPIVSHGFVYWLSGGWLNAWSLPSSVTPSPTDTALATGTPTPVVPTPTVPAEATSTATPTCQNYNYSLSAGTMISGTFDIGNHCDFCYTTITLPFTVDLYGQTFTTAKAGSKGYLAFETAYAPFDIRCLPFSSATYVMAPFWVDQYTAQNACATCGIYTATVGTAPNRTFIVEYRMRYFNQQESSPTLDYEIQLHEGQSTFDYVYGLITSYSNTDSSLTIGVQRSHNPDIFTSYYCDPSGHTPPPLAGQKLTWTYSTCSQGTATATVPATSTATSIATVVATGTASVTAVATSQVTPTTGVPSPTATVPQEATATSSPAATATACTIQFSDVPIGNPFYYNILCMACLGIVNGYPDGTFRPNNNVTRGQLSKIVTLSAGFNDPPGEQIFEDVPEGSTFYVYVQRLASRGYIVGYPCGGPGEACIPPENRPYFRPGANATRGQLTKIVSNAAGFSDPPGAQIFEDIAPGSTFYDFIQRLASRLVMQGYPCGGSGEPCVPPGNRHYFRQNNNATRGQAVKIVSNTFFPGCENPGP
jgi:outer membrane protein assembly factor BamB